MKTFVKLISLTLVCIMMLTTLLACTGGVPTADSTTTDAQSEEASASDTDTSTSSDTESDSNDTESSSNDTESADATSSESSEEENDTEDGSASSESESAEDVTTQLDGFPKNSFPILANGKYVSNIVVSSTAGSEERLVASELKSLLKKETSVDTSVDTDLILNDENYDKGSYEIIIGHTAHEASRKVYDGTSYNAYGVKAIGNKIVFFFSTKAEGLELVEQFERSLRSNDEGQFWVSSTLSLVNTIAPELNSLPAYPATNTDTDITIVDCYDNTKMIVIKNTTLEKFNEYCNTLKTKKFVEYSKRENIDGNYFRIYTKDNTAVNAYFSNGRKQARIIVGPLKDIPSKEKDTTPETNKNPTLTMIGPSESTENGLALIYHLPNGKFLVIDGGYNLSDRLYKEFRELQPTGPIVVTGWFMSHPHIDHQESLEVVIEQHGHEIEIENIYFNYLHPEYYDDITGDSSASAKEGHSVTRLRELISKKLSRKTNIVKPHTGQIYTFGSATVEIISTIEDYLPGRIDNINTSSMIVRVNVKGTTTMVLADATSTLNEILLAMYNSHLESNMVTLAHHGIWVDTPEMYKRVSAEVLLWPSNTKRAQEFYHGNRAPSNTTYSKPAINEALKQATDVFLARGTDTVLSLPYKTVGNKQDFINNVLN